MNRVDSGIPLKYSSPKACLFLFFAIYLTVLFYDALLKANQNLLHPLKKVGEVKMILEDADINRRGK